MGQQSGRERKVVDDRSWPVSGGAITKERFIYRIWSKILIKDWILDEFTRLLQGLNSHSKDRMSSHVQVSKNNRRTAKRSFQDGVTTATIAVVS